RRGAVIEEPVVVPRQEGLVNFEVRHAVREHVEARVHDFAADAIRALFVEPSGWVENTGVQPGIAAGQALLRGRVIQAVAGDSEPADREGADARNGERFAGLAIVVLDDARRALTEAAIEPIEDLARLDHVRIAGVVAHLAPR